MNVNTTIRRGIARLPYEFAHQAALDLARLLIVSNDLQLDITSLYLTGSLGQSLSHSRKPATVYDIDLVIIVGPAGWEDYFQALADEHEPPDMVTTRHRLAAFWSYVQNRTGSSRLLLPWIEDYRLWQTIGGRRPKRASIQADNPYRWPSPSFTPLLDIFVVPPWWRVHDLQDPIAASLIAIDEEASIQASSQASRIIDVPAASALQQLRRLMQDAAPYSSLTGSFGMQGEMLPLDL